VRIIYWNNSCLEPEIEAISKEVFQLARHFQGSWLFGINPHYRLRWSLRNRYVGFHPSFDPILRVLIPLVERYADINHVYGEPCPWIFYKTVKRRPLVLTIASEKGEGNCEFFDRCRKIIVQTEHYRKKLLALGIENKKVELLYPGLDLSQFEPIVRSQGIQGTPTVLFATAPRAREEMEGRGVNLLLQAAKGGSDIHFHLLYRPWRTGYTSLKPTKDFIATQNLKNVTLTNTVVHDMSTVYREFHFLVIPFTRSDGGKECPTSLIEGLACGLPVLISSVSPFAYFIEQHQCGVVFEPTPSGLIQAVEKGMRQYAELSRNGITAARAHFSEANVLKGHERIYREVA